MYIHMYPYSPLYPWVYTPICSMATAPLTPCGDMAKGSKGVQMGSYGVNPWGVPPSHDMPWVMTQGMMSTLWPFMSIMGTLP